MSSLMRPIDGQCEETSEENFLATTKLRICPHCESANGQKQNKCRICGEILAGIDCIEDLPTKTPVRRIGMSSDTLFHRVSRSNIKSSAFNAMHKKQLNFPFEDYSKSFKSLLTKKDAFRYRHITKCRSSVRKKLTRFQLPLRQELHRQSHRRRLSLSTLGKTINALMLVISGAGITYFFMSFSLGNVEGLFFNYFTAHHQNAVISSTSVVSSPKQEIRKAEIPIQKDSGDSAIMLSVPGVSSVSNEFESVKNPDHDIRAEIPAKTQHSKSPRPNNNLNVIEGFGHVEGKSTSVDVNATKSEHCSDALVALRLCPYQRD